MNESLPETGSGTEALAGKYLTFQLDAESYGLAILKVQEIIGMIEVTPVPGTPPFVRGVINLRGRIISVVDLRVKFNGIAKESTERPCVIVLRMEQCGAPITIGIIVDEVSEVLDIRADRLAPRPSFGDRVDLDFIMGMGKVGRKVVMLLDADRVLSDREVDSVIDVTKVEVPVGLASGEPIRSAATIPCLH